MCGHDKTPLLDVQPITPSRIIVDQLKQEYDANSRFGIERLLSQQFSIEIDARFVPTNDNKLFDWLLNKKQIQCNIDVLGELLKKLKSLDAGDPNIIRWYKKVLEKPNFDLNRPLPPQFSKERYILDYAAEFCEQDIVLDLLDKGASLANRNEDKLLSIEHMDCEIVNKHFDLCVSRRRKTQNRRDTEIDFNYSTLMPGNKDGEMSVISAIRSSNELLPLLSHPLIVAFLDIKWSVLQWLFYVNIAFYMMFCTSLFIFTRSFYYGQSIHIASCICFSILISFLLLRKLAQIFAYRWQYLKNLENWIELVLLIAVGIMLLWQNVEKYNRKLIAVVIILSASFELFFLSGQHPKLAIRVRMFRTALTTFFEYLASYCLLILTFAFCFHCIFADKTDEGNWFVKYPSAIFRTFVMLTGEIDVDSLELSGNVASYVIFLLFIFTMMLILMNLLTGLAISDTQQIREQARHDLIKERASYLSKTEEKLIKFMNVFKCLNINWIENFYKKRVLVFDHCSRQMRVFPYRGNKVLFNEHCTVENRCGCGDLKINDDEVLRTIAQTEKVTVVCPNCRYAFT